MKHVGVSGHHVPSAEVRLHVSPTTCTWATAQSSRLSLPASQTICGAEGPTEQRAVDQGACAQKAGA